jgi:hypothetical protein
MAKDKSIGFIVVGSILGIVGFIMIFFSVNFGISLAESWLINQGGAADTATYNIIRKSYINTFLVAGSILFGLGLLIVTSTYFLLLKK